MKRFVLLLAMMLSGVAAHAYDPQIRDIKITCVLDSNGCAHITEVWDVCVASGTEWYLVRGNLGDIELQNLRVEENGKVFEKLQLWDVNASQYQKTGKCGLNPIYDGYEICWGVGDYGDHVFTVSYDMTNAVKSLEDYDILHLQFISDQLSSQPLHASVKVSVEGVSLNDENAGIWGFGYAGLTAFEGGSILAQTESGLGYDDSVILLIRLDKGLISSPSSELYEDFQSHLDRALEGSDWAETPLTWGGKIKRQIDKLLHYWWVPMIVAWLYISDEKKRRKFLGGPKKEVSWCRDIPFDGNLCITEFALGKITEGSEKNRIASAMILKMIQVGAIEVYNTAVGEDQVDLAFGDKARLEGLPEPVGKLWDMMYEASGTDQILQDKEFSEWSSKNKKRVSDWVDEVDTSGEKLFVAGGYGSTYAANQKGIAEVRKAYGLKKFLLDFTLIREHASREVVLWENYLVFGALFGVADKVAAELKDIAPDLYTESFEKVSMPRVISMSGHLADSITSARSQHLSSSGGHGGSSSRGGGGGHSGGGHGGGSR